MDLDKLTLGELRELNGLFKTKGTKKHNTVDHGIKIVILQRGWVVVGHYIQQGEYITLSKAAVVRKWGTSNGLPELALKGPLSATVLDKGPEIRFHALTEVASIKCAEDKWLGKLEV